MAILSKPSKTVTKLITAYITALYMNPIRTKSLTAAIIATLGNYTAQSLKSSKIDFQTLGSFGMFGLLFGGTIPHFFYTFLTRVIDEDSRLAPFKMLLVERLLYTPIFQFFSLYMINRLQLKSHSDALRTVSRFYPSTLEANYQYLTILQFVNMYFVPPILRVLFQNLIGFLWVIYVSKKWNPPARKSQSKGTRK